MTPSFFNDTSLQTRTQIKMKKKKTVACSATALRQTNKYISQPLQLLFLAHFRKPEATKIVAFSATTSRLCSTGPLLTLESQRVLMMMTMFSV